MSNAIISIQNELKAPKGQFNSFGRYKYRSCEDILEAVKPLLHKYSCSLNISDEVVMVGDRFYIKATATLRKDTGEVISSSVAYAREDESKKGMDGAQVTGAASSYARKYALNGLFCIDDTKDADTDEYTKNTKPEKEPAEKDKNCNLYIQLEKKLTESKIEIDALMKYLKANDKRLPKVVTYESLPEKYLEALIKNFDSISNKIKGDDVDA